VGDGYVCVCVSPCARLLVLLALCPPSACPLRAFCLLSVCPLSALCLPCACHLAAICLSSGCPLPVRCLPSAPARCVLSACLLPAICLPSACPGRTFRDAVCAPDTHPLLCHQVTAGAGVGSTGAPSLSGPGSAVGTGTGAVAKVPGATVRGRASFTIPVFVEVLRHVPQVGPRQIYNPTRVIEMVACAAAVCRGPVTDCVGPLR
jgi:hypothetical protein